jgi:hypothetical protein
MAKKKRKHGKRHGHHGVGTTLTLRGLGRAGRMRGAGSIAMFLVPPLVGGGLAALTIMAARYFTTPKAGTTFSTTTKMVYKNAPWIGLAAGAVGSLATFMLMGQSAGAGLSAGAAALIASLVAFGQDKMLMGTPDAAGVAATALLTPSTPAAAAAAGLGTVYSARLGAVVPQLQQGTGAIVMEPTHGIPTRAYTGGQTVSLGNVNARAFGTDQMS